MGRSGGRRDRGRRSLDQPSRRPDARRARDSKTPEGTSVLTRSPSMQAPWLRLQFSCPFGQDEPYGTAGSHNGLIHEFASCGPRTRSCPQRVHERGSRRRGLPANWPPAPPARAARPRRRAAPAARRVRPERLTAGDPPRLGIDALDESRPRRDQQPGGDAQDRPPRGLARLELAAERAARRRRPRPATPRCRRRRRAPRAARRRAGSRPPRSRCRGACRRPRGGASAARPASRARGG